MPFEWTDPARRLVLRPHRSLPRKGFAAVIGVFFVLLMVPLIGVLGTAVLWGLLPFGLGALAALWWGLERSYRSGRILEILSIEDGEVHLSRTEPDGRQRDWRCNSYWVTVEMHAKGGPLPDYVTLSGNGRRVEIGAFLAEDERRALYADLSRRFPVR